MQYIELDLSNNEATIKSVDGELAQGNVGSVELHIINPEESWTSGSVWATFSKAGVEMSRLTALVDGKYVTDVPSEMFVDDRNFGIFVWCIIGESYVETRRIARVSLSETGVIKATTEIVSEEEKSTVMQMLGRMDTLYKIVENAEKDRYAKYYKAEGLTEEELNSETLKSRQVLYNEAEEVRDDLYHKEEGTINDTTAAMTRWGNHFRMEAERNEKYEAIEGNESDSSDKSTRWGRYKKAEEERGAKYQEAEDNRTNVLYEDAEKARTAQYLAIEGVDEDYLNSDYFETREQKFGRAEEDRITRFEVAQMQRTAAYEAAEGTASDMPTKESRWGKYNKAESKRNTNYNSREDERDNDYFKAEAERNNSYENAEAERESVINSLATVATSGSYEDLSDKPTILSEDDVIKIHRYHEYPVLRAEADMYGNKIHLIYARLSDIVTSYNNLTDTPITILSSYPSTDEELNKLIDGVYCYIDVGTSPTSNLFIIASHTENWKYIDDDKDKGDYKQEQWTQVIIDDKGVKKRQKTNNRAFSDGRPEYTIDWHYVISDPLVEEKLGDVETALDGIIAIQNNLLGVSE